MIILGIDPGIASTGYGILKLRKEARTKKIECLACNVIHTKPTLGQGERLKKINNELSRIIRDYKPQVLALENVFFFKNLKTAIPVARAEGVILLTAAKKKLPVFGFTPLQVKLAITGKGRAEKKEVQSQLKKLLKLKEVPKSDDAADALAIALTYFLKES